MHKTITTLTLTTLLISTFLFQVVVPTNAQQSVNKISQENARKGTTKWKSDSLNNKILTKHQSVLSEEAPATAALEPDQRAAALAAPTQPTINGYAGKTSINKGESITMHVSSAKSTYNIEFYRLGYYNGDGARLIKTVNNLAGVRRSIPSPKAGTGLIEANWPVSYTLQTDNSWTSGLYLAKLVIGSDTPGYIPFVLRDDNSSAPILYQIPVTTYQAYNDWGGKSLYDFNSTNGRAYQISFDRPYTGYDGAGSVFDGDYNMIRYLESKGYNVTYATNVDTHTNPNLLQNRKVFLSNWHDEYYSKAMRDNLTAARDRGVSLAIFGANSMYWQIRIENGTNGANRTITCYKDAALDPLASSQPAQATVTFRSAPVNRPENELLGSMYESDWNWGDSFPWIVKNASHWIYAGTGVSEGNSIAGLVGYEYDKVFDNGKTPANLTILSDSPVRDNSGLNSKQQSTLYQASSGAWVFNASTIYWAWKLDNNDYHTGADSRVQKMTDNLLNRMISGTTSPSPTPTPTTAPTSTPTPTVAPTATPQPTVVPTKTASPSPTVAPSTTPTPTSSPSTMTYIYNDALASGWSNWSWSSQLTFNDKTAIFSGTNDLKWVNTAKWAGLYLHKNTALNTSPFTTLSFALRRSTTNQAYSVMLYNTSNSPIGSAKSLNNFGGLPPVNTYQLYNIPLSQIGGSNTTISGVQIQDDAGIASGTTYLDQIGFK